MQTKPIHPPLNLNAIFFWLGVLLILFVALITLPAWAFLLILAAGFITVGFLSPFPEPAVK